MAFTGAQKPVLTAAAFLAFDEGQLAQYLEGNDDIDSGFVIPKLDSVEDLSGSQEEKLEAKLR